MFRHDHGRRRTPRVNILMGIKARAYSRLRGSRPVRWAAARLSPEARRVVRRLLGRPSPAGPSRSVIGPSRPSSVPAAA